MIRIFYGRETVDKAKFIFEHAGTRPLVLVPDQFTLEAEREALFHLGKEAILDPEITSISRLGFRLLSETGGVKKRMIDPYGRHILLTSVIGELADKGALKVYGALSGKGSFTELVNDFISNLKQRSIRPEMASEIQAALPQDEILARKMADLCRIYARYEEKLAGNLLDTEDYIDLFIPAVGKSKALAGREIWIWGFDSLAPKNAEFVKALMQVCSVNLVVTASLDRRDRELFSATRHLMEQMARAAQELGTECVIEEMKGSPKAEAGRESAGMVLERELFSIPPLPEEPGNASSQVTLTAAANCYSEAASAAAYVTRLLRDKGLRRRDILLVCNDLNSRGTIIKRVFAEYGMSVFTDEKRSILSNPAVIYVLSLLEIIAGGYKTKDIFRFLKTGLTPLGAEQISELENYAIKYKIRGGFWKKPFRYGKQEYGEEDFAALETEREALILFLSEFETEFRASRRAEDRIRALYRFLSGKAELPGRIDALAQEQADLGFTDAAQELAQVYAAILSVLDQIVNGIGEETPSVETLVELLRAGFESVQLGILPPAADGLVLGTMQRTRTGRVRALVVLGANDGILPLEILPEELLSEDEKKRLSEQSLEVADLTEQRVLEEKLAIYRTLSLPSEFLYMSYAASDPEGNEQRPSRIFQTVRKIFPSVEVSGALEETGKREPMVLMEEERSALGYFVTAIRENLSSGASEAAVEWRALAEWYRRNEGELLKRASAGLLFRNRDARLSPESAERLYRSGGADPVISPSRLERYGRCPFSHFISYGLRPEERRIFEAGMREIGDVYHECLMRFSDILSERGEWQTITKEESDARLEELIEKTAGQYREGLFDSGAEESYRRTRMKEVLKEAGWMLVLQCRSGRIEKMYFEESFGQSEEKKFPPIEVETSRGTVRIEGKIDRVDVLEGGAVKVIDYKSGNEKFDVDEARGGWRLQLLLYLKAALREKKSGEEHPPAGVFYFMIRDAELAGDGINEKEAAEKLSEEIKKEFRMSGLIVDRGSNVEDIAGDFMRYSDIVEGLQKVRASKETGGNEDAGPDTIYKGCVMNEEEFSELSAAFDRKIRELTDALICGEISVRPKRVRDKTACRFCTYHSICGFDLNIPGFSYEKIL